MVKINRKWAVVTCLMALLIWGNSLVPGSGSGSLSLTVMEAIRGFLHGVGLPYEWVTNFVVRKCAHFTEYMVLGILATHAFDFEGRRTFDVLLPTAVFLLLIPSVLEQKLHHFPHMWQTEKVHLRIGRKTNCLQKQS